MGVVCFKNMNPRDAAISNQCQQVMLLAEVYALKRTTEAALRQLGLDQIEGLPFAQFYDKQCADQIERVLLAVGDKNPPLAEELQERLRQLLKNPSGS